MTPPNIEPWISFNRKTCVLGGNSEGFRCLRDSIDRLIAGDANPIDIEGEEIDICEIRLAEKPQDIPRPPLGSARNLVLFILLMILVFGLAGIGLIVSVNWLTAL